MYNWTFVGFFEDSQIFKSYPQDGFLVEETKESCPKLILYRKYHTCIIVGFTKNGHSKVLRMTLFHLKFTILLYNLFSSIHIFILNYKTKMFFYHNLYTGSKRMLFLLLNKPRNDCFHCTKQLVPSFIYIYIYIKLLQVKTM